MATLTSSSPDYISPISQALSRRKFPRKRPLEYNPALEEVAEEEKETKKKKKKKNKKKRKKLSSSVTWNEEDELSLLKGLVDYRVEKGLQPNSDSDAFYRFLRDSIVSKFSKEQLLSKISMLKKRFLEGNDPLFTDTEAFELSNMIWGQNDSQFPNDNCEEMLHAAATLEPSKKKKKLDTPVIWTEDDEIAVLKGLIEYRHKTGEESNIDWNAYFDFVKGSVNANVSKKQMFSKIRELRRFYEDSVERISKGLDPLFTRDIDSQVFGYSSMLWGQNEDEVANTGLENALQTENGVNQEETCKDNEQVVNAELVNQNDVEKSKFDGKSVNEETTEYKTDDEENIGSQIGVNAVNIQNENSEDEQEANVEPLNGDVTEKRDFDDKIKEKETTGKESNEDNDVVDDELCTVKDAFETMMSEGLSAYQKKLQLEKLMNIGTRKRKEFSSEWKEICDDEAKLILKTLRLSIVLAEGANQG